MFRSAPRRLLCIVPAVMTLVLAGCSAGGGASEGSHEVGSWVASYLETIRNDPSVTLSSFEERVLADSFVSDEEYREAQDLFRRCMEDLGWEVTIRDDHSIEVVGALDGPRMFDQVPQEEMESCQSGTLFHIQPILIAQNYNPDGLSPADLIRNCLSKIGSGLAAEMTDEELLDVQLEVSDGRRRVDVEDALCLSDPTGEKGLDEQNIAEYFGWDR